MWTHRWGQINTLAGARLDEVRAIPSEYALENNYPNPFNPTTQILYRLPEAGKVSLVFYNLLGQQIRVLMDDYREAGYYRVVWDGKDQHGRQVASGVYFYQFVSRGGVLTKRMLLLK